MIEIKSRTHALRLFAQSVRFGDLFKAVLYTGYRGDKDKIPFYYSKYTGHSSYIDLTEPMDTIFASMKSNTRNEIRRAEREGITAQEGNSMERFIEFYNDFCKSKGLNDLTSQSRMSKYPNVMLTEAVQGGNILAMHANVLDEGSRIAFLLYSCSPRFESGIDKKLIGWGNRYLHYKDLEWLKEKGYKIYDWSGVCTDPDNPRYSIGQFKLSFGGKLVESIVLKSPLFFMAEWLRSVVRKVRESLRSV